MPTEVKGAIALRKALREFTPDLAKETQKEIGNLLKPITKKARGFIPGSAPLSGWGKEGNWGVRGYSSSDIKRGIGYKTTPSKPNRRGFRSLARVFNKSAAGAIYETMGRNTPNSRFVQNQNNKHPNQMKGKDKMEGRALFRAYEENNGKAREAVLKAISTAADKLNAKAKV